MVHKKSRIPTVPKQSEPESSDPESSSESSLESSTSEDQSDSSGKEMKSNRVQMVTHLRSHRVLG